VRIATRRDEEELIEFCRIEHAANGFGEFNPVRLRQTLRRAFEPRRNDLGVIGIAGERQIEGSLGLMVETPFNSEQPFLQQIWNFVLPEYRRSTHARDLIAWANCMAMPATEGGLGLPVWIHAMSTPRTEAHLRMMKRQFGEPVGYSWVCGADMGAA
jgi:hypothetical protein